MPQGSWGTLSGGGLQQQKMGEEERARRGGINLESRESTRMGICKFTNTFGVSGICAEESLPCRQPSLRLKLDGTRLRERLYLASGACNLPARQTWPCISIKYPPRLRGGRAGGGKGGEYRAGLKITFPSSVNMGETIAFSCLHQV